ncbi:hypothetical protein AAFF_G00117300 [Aldrovandia affinis]|uniref:Uncharacterized protein n=1 Tax=Aldrovandia affinis TaxID=143900 RepID=A0AAD7T1N9_9TELE|nr:hypothetical protein AAFF_G00117300 [Aldrovandia affinis]
MKPCLVTWKKGRSTVSETALCFDCGATFAQIYLRALGLSAGASEGQEQGEKSISWVSWRGEKVQAVGPVMTMLRMGDATLADEAGHILYKCKGGGMLAVGVLLGLIVLVHSEPPLAPHSIGMEVPFRGSDRGP